MGDIFADLLKGANGSNVKSTSNLSLNERISASKTNSGNVHNSGNLDLDFLDSYVSKPRPDIKQKKNLNEYKVGNLDFAGLNIETKLNSNSSSNTNSNQQSVNLLDDFFGQPLELQKPTQSNTNSLLEIDNHQPTEIIHSESSSKGAATSNRQERKDKALAELVDMGFQPTQAMDALNTTSSGYDVNEAISYLMESAHSRSKPSPRSHRQDDPSQIVNDISSNFMSAASFLLSSGKSHIQKGVEMYRKQKLESRGGQPAWMKNQEQYKANSIQIPDWDDEERDQIINHEPTRELPKEQKYNRTQPQYKSTNDLLFDEPIRMRNPRNRRSPSAAPKETIHHNNQHNETASPTLKEQVPHLNNTDHVDLLGGIEPTGFQIPPLNSAQKMTLNHSREIAQTSFKAGDFVKSLENYIEATTVIPLNHPFQIILQSNLALIYSKLGNSKEQFECSNKGLILIEEIMKSENVTVYNLSGIVVEEGKDLKSLWSKLLLKKSEALESLEKWGEAKLAYDELIKNGISSKTIMEGRNRCNKALAPPPIKQQTRKQPTKSDIKLESGHDSAKLQRVKENGMQKKKEEEEKFQLHDKVEMRLETWRRGNKDNIRALICSLETVLWPELNWKPVKLTDLVMDKKVKINYMKAVSKTHPDKISSTESTENKMLANGVFITLNEAWETFKNTNGL